MTATQLTLLDVPVVPKLTAKQQTVHDRLQAAGSAGVTADEIGALFHEQRGRHPAESRCLHCGSEGRQLLTALRDKGLARFRRKLGVWQTTDRKALTAADTANRPAGWGELPEGF